MKVVRYGLGKGVTKVFNDNNEQIEVLSVGEQPVFLDILSEMTEGTCLFVDVRIYCLDGRIITGKIPGWKVLIFNQDALYDGRFNSTNYEKTSL